MSDSDYVTIYQRADGLWAWKRQDPGNWSILATDGGQGYGGQGDVTRMAMRVNGPGCVYRREIHPGKVEALTYVEEEG